MEDYFLREISILFLCTCLCYETEVKTVCANCGAHYSMRGRPAPPALLFPLRWGTLDSHGIGRSFSAVWTEPNIYKEEPGLSRRHSYSWGGGGSSASVCYPGVCVCSRSSGGRALTAMCRALILTALLAVVCVSNALKLRKYHQGPMQLVAKKMSLRWFKWMEALLSSYDTVIVGLSFVSGSLYPMF